MTKYKSIHEIDETLDSDVLHGNKGTFGDMEGVFVTNKYERPFDNSNRRRVYFLTNSVPRNIHYTKQLPQNRNYLKRYNKKYSVIVSSVAKGCTIHDFRMLRKENGAFAIKVNIKKYIRTPNFVSICCETN